MCSEYSMTMMEHIGELLMRGLYVFLSIVITFCITYTYSLEVFYFLAKPLINLTMTEYDYSLIYTDMAEAFFTYVNISIYISLFIGSLVFIHQWCCFILPGLYPKEARFLLNAKKILYIFFVLSSLTTYFWIIPLIWEFFVNNETSNTSSTMNINFETKLTEYVYTLLKVFFAINCVFFIPLTLLVFLKLKFISINLILECRKFAFTSSFILGALLSPPDIFSQFLLAIPLCMSYELVICIALYDKIVKEPQKLIN